MPGGSLNHRVDAGLGDLRRALEGGDLLLALHRPELAHHDRHVLEGGVGKGLVQRLPLGEGDGTFHRPQVPAQATDADLRFRVAQLLQATDDRLGPVEPLRGPHVRNPILLGGPEVGAIEHERRYVTLEREHTGSTRSAASAVAEIAGVGLPLGVVPGVGVTDDHVDPTIGHRLAYAAPAVVPLLGRKLGHLEFLGHPMILLQASADGTPCPHAGQPVPGRCFRLSSDSRLGARAYSTTCPSWSRCTIGRSSSLRPGSMTVRSPTTTIRQLRRVDVSGDALHVVERHAARPLDLWLK